MLGLLGSPVLAVTGGSERRLVSRACAWLDAAKLVHSNVK